MESSILNKFLLALSKTKDALLEDLENEYISIRKIAEGAAEDNHGSASEGLVAVETVINAVFERIGFDVSNYKETKELVNAVEAVRGFVTGKAENAAGTAGAILSDFFLYGDLRDLGIQFARKLRGRPADTTLAVMAGIGVVTEISGLGKWAPSVLKQLRRAEDSFPA